jgi:hypothetical protein
MQVMYGTDSDASILVEHTEDPLVEAQALSAAAVHELLQPMAVVTEDDEKKRRRAETVARGSKARQMPCCGKYTKNPLRDKVTSTMGE